MTPSPSPGATNASTATQAYSVNKAEIAEIKLASWSPEKIAAATNRVHRVGLSLGINFKAKGEGGGKAMKVRDALVAKLFEAFHGLKRDISDGVVLRQIAVDAGLDEEEVDVWLDSDLGEEIVDEETVRNREEVNSGVLSFIVQEEHRVDGAQDPQDLEIFVKVKEADAEE